MSKIIKILRPEQWIKNLFIFLPLFFSGRITNLPLLLDCIIGFFAFSFTASSIYCLNDIVDIEADRAHPKKRNRPIASGALSIPAAYSIMAVTLLLGIFIAVFLLKINYLEALGLLIFYYVLNIAYCLYLKRKPLIDVFIVATGFVIRIVFGGAITYTYISPWIVIMTFLLALFLALAKRRDDMVIYENTGVKMRGNINRYNLDYINQAITIIATITIVAYIMYSTSPDVTERMHSQYVYTTSIFVLLGILRYLQLTIVDVKSGSPTKVLLKDRFIQLCVACWLIAFLLIIYI